MSGVTIQDCHLIIPAAGRGKRMQSLTGGNPKEMLLIKGRPLILIAVLEGVRAGIRNITIVINKNKEILRALFEDEGFIKNRFPGLIEEIWKLKESSQIYFAYQAIPLGEADAISCAEPFIPSGKSIATIYPDNVSFSKRPIMEILFNQFQKTNLDTIALMKVEKNLIPGLSNSGRLELHKLSEQVYEIKKILNKSPGIYPEEKVNSLRGCGFSISGNYIFDYIRKARKIRGDSGNRELIDIDFRRLILKDRPVLGVRIPGTVADAGNPAGYKLCCKLAETYKSFPYIF